MVSNNGKQRYNEDQANMVFHTEEPESIPIANNGKPKKNHRARLPAHVSDAAFLSPDLENSVAAPHTENPH